eukprot:3315404-Prymnesium_polylepis.1
MDGTRTGGHTRATTTHGEARNPANGLNHLRAPRCLGRSECRGQSGLCDAARSRIRTCSGAGEALTAELLSELNDGHLSHAQGPWLRALGARGPRARGTAGPRTA